MAIAWLVWTEFIAGLQWLGVFGSDDQTWQAVFVGNVAYISVIFALPLLAGAFVYVFALRAARTTSPERQRTIAALLAPVVALPFLVIAFLTVGRIGALFAAGYAALSVLTLRLVERRFVYETRAPRPRRNRSPEHPWW